MALSIDELRRLSQQKAKKIDAVETEMKNRIASAGPAIPTVQTGTNIQSTQIAPRLDISSPSYSRPVIHGLDQLPSLRNAAKEIPNPNAALGIGGGIPNYLSVDPQKWSMQNIDPRLEITLMDRATENGADPWRAQQSNAIFSAGGNALMFEIMDLVELKAAADVEQKANMGSEILQAPSESWNRYQQQVRDLKAQYGDEVTDWIAYIEQVANQVSNDKFAEDMRQAGKDANLLDKAVLSLATVPMNMISGGGYLDAATQKVQRAVTGSEIPVDYNRAAQGASTFTNSVRGGVSEEMGSGGQFLYGVGMSMLDMLPAIIGGRVNPENMAAISKLNTALLGGSAATSAMQDARQRGATDEQALSIGFVAGAMEAVMEKLSIDSLFGLAASKSRTAVILNALKQAGAEGLEEGLTTLANTIADILIMGDKNEILTRQREIMAANPNMSEADALKEAQKEWGINLGLDALGGAFSGGLFGGFKSGADYRRYKAVESVMPKIQQDTQVTGNEKVAKVVQDLAGQNKNAPVALTEAESKIPLLLPEQSEITKQRGYPYPKKDAVYKVVEIPQSKVDEIEAYINTMTDAEAKGKYKRIIKKLFMGQKFTNVNTLAKNVAYEIGVSSKGIGEIITRQPVNAQTLAMLEQLDEIIENAKYVASEPTSHEERRGIERTDRFETATKVGDQPGVAKMRVNVTKDGNKLYFATNKITEAQSPQPWADNSRRHGVEETASANPDIPQTEQSVNWENVGDMGAKTSEFEHEVKQSRTATNTIGKNEARWEVPEDARTDASYTAVTEKESLNNARMRLEQDTSGEMEYLRNAPVWNNEEVDMGMLILGGFRQQAKKTGDWSQFKNWAKVAKQHGVSAGQGLQAWAKYTRMTADGIMNTAAEMLETASSNTDIDEVLRVVSEYADRFEAANTEKDADALLRIIKDTSHVRKTGSLFKNELSKTMNWAMDHVVKMAKQGGDKYYDFLRNFAAAGIENIAGDHTEISLGEVAKTTRYNAMLSKVATVLRNLVTNGVLGPVDSIARNISVPLDILLSKSTGTRSIAIDRSVFSKEARRGYMDALAMSLMEVGLDVNASGAANKYERSAKRTFKMAGHPLFRLLSTMEKWTGYTMTTTDDVAKGGTAAEVQRGIDRLYEQNKIKDDSLRDAGQQEARYRTLQDDTALSELSGNVRRGLNKFSGSFTGSEDFGAGDFIMPFVKVPSNMPARIAEYSPIGLASNLAKLNDISQMQHLLSAMEASEKGVMTAADQAKIVQGIGRGVTGTGIIALFTALGLKGLLHSVGAGGTEENKDKTAYEKMQGLKDTQFNLSGAIRGLNGGDDGYQSGDTLVSIDFLNPFNAHMNIGVLLAEDIKNGDLTLGNIAEDTLAGLFEAVLDIPMLSSIQDIVDGVQYSGGDNLGEQVGAGILSYLSAQPASWIPNFVKGIAQGMDDTERDLYTSETVIGQAWDKVKAGIPGLRQTLPAKLDSWGREMKNEGGVQNFLNTNINPGSATTYKEDPVDAAIRMLFEDTGDASIYPDRKAPTSITVDDQTVELTNDQQRTFQQTRGQTEYDTKATLIEDDVYAGFDNDAKVKAMQDAEDYAKQTAKEDLGIGYKPDTWVKELEGKSQEEIVNAIIMRTIESSLGSKEQRYSDLAEQLDSGVPEATIIGILSESQQENYNTYAKNVPLETYLEALGAKSAAKGEPDKDGNTIDGSKRKEVVDWIGKQNLTIAQKKSLYLSLGYAESTCPWK